MPFWYPLVAQLEPTENVCSLKVGGATLVAFHITVHCYTAVEVLSFRMHNVDVQHCRQSPYVEGQYFGLDFLVGRNEKVWICAQANVVNQKKGNRHLNLFVRAWLLPVAGMGPLM